ncbi:MAG: hypothetical protein K2X43_00700 [Hyphomonadaceae bacterium]|nr:hypothetical protein [Hyphomonadaceae bacterium]
MTEIAGKSLVHCDVAQDGSEVRLNFESASGSPISIALPMGCIEQLLMTLPAVVSMAIRAKYRDDSLRLVFPLGDWKLETGGGKKAALILTLKTPDGFEVAFTVVREDLMLMSSTAEAKTEAVNSGRPYWH